MLEFKLPDMNCNHCVSTVSKTVKAVDTQAEVNVDLGSRTVRIESPKNTAEFAAALTEAGYPPA